MGFFILSDSYKKGHNEGISVTLCDTDNLPLFLETLSLSEVDSLTGEAWGTLCNLPLSWTGRNHDRKENKCITHQIPQCKAPGRSEGGIAIYTDVSSGFMLIHLFQGTLNACTCTWGVSPPPFYF